MCLCVKEIVGSVMMAGGMVWWGTGFLKDCGEQAGTK